MSDRTFETKWVQCAGFEPALGHRVPQPLETWCKPVAKGVPDGRFSHTTGTQQARVLKGYHPMGHPMPKPGARACNETCGSCGHRETATTMSGKPSFSKCALAPQSSGKATDTRRRWPACAKWESKGAVEEDRQAEENAARMP